MTGIRTKAAWIVGGILITPVVAAVATVIYLAWLWKMATEELS